MNLFFIKTFTILAQTGSFQKTAHLNHITQSAVSQQINTLETKLNCQLFTRSKKHISLTSKGQTFLKHAESILKDYEQAVIELNRENEILSGDITIATNYSIGLYRLQPIIRRFLKQNPKVNIHLEYFHNTLIYEKLMNRTVDFGFVAHPKPATKLKVITFTEEPMVLIQSTDRTNLTKKTISIAELKNSRYVCLSKTTPTGKKIYTTLKKLNIDPFAIKEFENVETLKSAILIGMGCGFIPKNAVTNEIQRGELKIVNVKELTLTRPLGIIHPQEMIFNKPKKKFYNIFN